jgi:hypothetical protein
MLHKGTRAARSVSAYLTAKKTEVWTGAFNEVATHVKASR